MLERTHRLNLYTNLSEVCLKQSIFYYDKVKVKIQGHRPTLLSSERTLLGEYACKK